MFDLLFGIIWSLGCVWCLLHDDIVKDAILSSKVRSHRWWVLMVLDSRFIWYADGYLTKQSIRYHWHPNNLHSISLEWEFEVYSHVEIPSFLKGFISSSFFGSRLLADYKMEAQLIIPPVIGGLPCHCWPSIPCSPASEFHLCWISKALSKSPRYKEKKLVNYIMQLENPSFINVHEHSPFRKLVDFFPARKIHRADDFPRLHVLNSTKLVGGGLALNRMTKIRFHHD